ncbi:protein Dek isoform X2 [Rhynchophorus ferrugineus]|uniref:protein Dek isoform X2 n=1 Tax=Rhynchophorus ferrugineus TaxID=354439 RepID=UPI003FCE3AD3
MTFTMSTEGDSVKSALSEANDKSVTDNHTDSSQDSADIKDEKPVNTEENNVSTETDGKPKGDSIEGESEQEPESDDKKNETNDKSVDEPVDKNAVQENNVEGVKEDDEEKVVEEKNEDVIVVETDNKAATDKDEVEVDNEKNEEENENEETVEEEEDEEEGSDSEKKYKKTKKAVPLLDQPLETSGKRERKNVQRFEEDFKSSEREPGKVEVEEGSGTPLGEIPRVEASIVRFKNEDLKILHKILFKTEGKANLLKKNIKKFNGFTFKKDSEDYKKKIETCKRLEVKSLKSICEMLDLEKKGNKDDVVERIVDFLLEPKDSGKPVGGGRPKRASAVRANNRGYSSHDDYSSDEKQASRSRRDKGKRSNLKDDTSSDEEFKPDDASDASDEKPRAVSKRKRGRAKKGSSEEDEASLSGGSSDDSDEEPKSKRRKSITKSNNKAKPKTPGRGRGRPPKSTNTTPARKRGRKPKDVSSEEEEEEEEEKLEEGSSSEDEPLVKKKTKSSEPPTDDEIKTFIKDILEGANLEEITMKTVCQRVYDNYPDFDLTARKKFIKSTVKSLIST